MYSISYLFFVNIYINIAHTSHKNHTKITQNLIQIPFFHTITYNISIQKYQTSKKKNSFDFVLILIINYGFSS